MKKNIYPIFISILIFGCSSSHKNVLPTNASDEQIVEWGKNCVTNYIEKNLKEGESYKLMEWILAEKRASIPVKVWQKNNSYKHDSITGCHKLLDTRGIFDEYAFIGKGDSAYVAFAVAYTINNKNGESAFLEKTFTLDNNGITTNCTDYISPMEIREQTEQMFLNAMRQAKEHVIKAAKEAAAMAGRDTNNISVIINGEKFSE